MGNMLNLDKLENIDHLKNMQRKRQAKPMPRPMILMIGIAFLAAGLFLTIKTIYNNATLTMETTGTIIKVDVTKEKVSTGSKKNNNKVRESYNPIVEYYVNQERYEGVTDLFSSNADEYKTGDKLPVKYNENDPSKFEISGKSSQKNILFAMCSIVVGVICSIVFFKTKNT